MNFTALNPTAAGAPGVTKSGGYLLSKGARSMREKRGLPKTKSSTPASVTTVFPVFCFLVNQSSSKPTNSTSMHKGRGKRKREKIFLNQNIRFAAPPIQV
jgi:hypothetical protein